MGALALVSSDSHMKRASSGTKRKTAVSGRKTATKSSAARKKAPSKKKVVRTARRLTRTSATRRQSKVSTASPAPKTKPKAKRTKIAKRKVAAPKVRKPGTSGTKRTTKKRVIRRVAKASRTTARKPKAKLPRKSAGKKPPLTRKVGAAKKPTTTATRKAPLRRRKTVRKVILDELASTGPVVSAAVPAARPVRRTTSRRPQAKSKRAGRVRSKTVISRRPGPPRRTWLRRRTKPDQALPKLPDFLLEGDEPSHPAAGPGEKFVLGPTTPLDHVAEGIMPLPESYGTGKVSVTPRDPHWLYAHWDVSRAEQATHNARSVDRHLILRLYATLDPDEPLQEVHVHPESKHWFVHTERPGESYFVELGYYRTDGSWHSLGKSESHQTPSDNISADSTVEFATVPFDLPFETMLALLKATGGKAAKPLAQSTEQLRPICTASFPFVPAGTEWSDEREIRLAEFIARAVIGSGPSSSEYVTSSADLSSSNHTLPGTATSQSSPDWQTVTSPGGGSSWFAAGGEPLESK